MESSCMGVRIWSVSMLLFSLMIITLASSYPRENEVDRLSLLAFKSEIVSDALGILSSWNDTSNLCGEWQGITCGRRHQRVTVLDLQSSQLNGTLSSRIGNLSFLRTLNLQNNSFYATIPQEIGRLSRLRSLHLGDNSFQGDIPVNISNCFHLQYLVLANNTLSGKLPMELGSLLKLQVLSLRRNNLVGEIPPSFGNLSSLEYLLMEENRLQGGLMSSLGKLKSLSVLALGMNNLSGTIPPSIYNLSSIQYISVIGNLLHGTLPSGLGYRIFPNRQVFRFQMNMFSGTIPSTISNASHLLQFGISFNHFTGEVPSLARVSSLVRLEMDDNFLRNEDGDLNFLSSLINCTSLQLLDISGNNFQGVLPESVSNLSTKLTVMTLGWNQLHGSIPIGIGNLLNLGLLSFEENLLADTIPTSVCSSGSVYWGVLDQPEERIVAVKVLNLHSSRASRSFISECEVLKNIRHRNLVRLLTACSSIDFQGNEFKALVFEFMLDGNLDEWLHYSAQRVVGLPIVQLHLNLLQRVNIAIDIASALDYLHNRFHVPIVHCDLKPSNVLLEKDMTACVCDFGLATFLLDTSCPVPSVQYPSNSIRGTIGYIAPEYGMGSAVSTHGDVYSYGILLLEMLTGTRPTDDMFRDDKNLHNFVLMALPERVKEICDPVLLQEKENCTSTNPASNRNDVQYDETQRIEDCLISIARIGVACSVHMPKARMEIGKVVAELRVIRDILTGNLDA
uniref:putative receptor-like protein kinase At3g47110 isoform X3 n=1 Tax=Fragaria vesca subsp. vesca TaxID=101020 RepID=UPI0005C8A4BF|nr:PREDICTED: putative receptor-like protein kinase At3g47110 isoform X3 [Fragaria vesca subsp. vesca]